MAYRETEKVERIKKAIEDIQYGSILITIHDGKITQVDITEKLRFSNVKNND